MKKNKQKDKGTPAFHRSEKIILVAEDDRVHRSLMEKILKESGFQTVSAENGVIALSMIDAGRHFDLIIMDWDMPELNGLETTREIRKRERENGGAHIPVMAFTSSRQPGDREQCLAAGMDAYLPKDVWMPRWRETLISNLEELIAGNFEIQCLEDASVPEAEDKNHFDLDAFDMQALEQSAALLKDELAIAVDEYLEDAASYIRDIKEGVESGDAEKAARGSHPLKSNSKGFGLTAVSEIAEAINTQARSGDLEALKLLLPQLQNAFHRAEKKLRETIKNAGY